MIEGRTILESNEVISMTNHQDQAFISHKTFKVGEFVHTAFVKSDGDQGRRTKWIEEGVSCEILSPKHGWKKGTIKLCLEFIPEDSQPVEDFSSPLDDIRQSMT